MLLLLTSIQLVHLTGPEHQAIEINPAEVTSVREPRGAFHARVRCTVYTADGKFVSVVETCSQVRSLIEQAK